MPSRWTSSSPAWVTSEPLPTARAKASAKRRSASFSILFALSEEGAKTTEDALDILHDYRLQGKQYKALHSKHEIAGKPFLKDGVWHCPDCDGRCRPNNSFCHRCGKKLGWR